MLSANFFVVFLTLNKMEKRARSLKNLMTIPDYAKDKGVTTVTVYNWIKEKRIQTVEIFGKKLVDISTFR